MQMQLNCGSKSIGIYYSCSKLYLGGFEDVDDDAGVVLELAVDLGGACWHLRGFAFAFWRQGSRGFYIRRS